MVERARVRLIRASQSDELREIFRQLSELEGGDGPKFSRRVLMDLAARVVGRAYEPMLLELCHLVRATLLADRRSHRGRSALAGPQAAGFEWLFWGVEEARAGAFRAAFAHLAGACRVPPSGGAAGGGEPGTPGSTLLVGEEAVVVAYADWRFELLYNRMASLAAMMELLVSTLGYRVLAEVADALAAPVLDRGAVSGAARDLARRFYAWLGDHLPTAHAQRKFHAMVAYMEETVGDEFTEDDIDDETVLRFWLRHQGEDAGASTGAKIDFRGYRNTFLAFLALARVLAAGMEIGRFERRIPIGSDIEAGELDPAADAPLQAGSAEDDPLALLEEEPAVAVKALNRRELALLRLPVGESAGVCRLPRSYLRAECFGPVQNRLAQALRRRVEPAEIAAIAAAGPAQSRYRTCIERLEEADAHVRRVAKACLYVVHRMGGPCTDGDADGTAGNVLALDFSLLREARQAFDGLNRAGFERSAPNDPDRAPAYLALTEVLPMVSERLATVLRTLGPPSKWELVEAEDRPIFAGAFARLYTQRPHGALRGARSGEHAGGGTAPRDRSRPADGADDGTARPAEGHP